MSAFLLTLGDLNGAVTIGITTRDWDRDWDGDIWDTEGIWGNPTAVERVRRFRYLEVIFLQCPFLQCWYFTQIIPFI